MGTQHTTADLKREIEQMEEEKEQITKRLERVKKRVDSVNNSSAMLEMSRNYRLEVEREEKINLQKAELKSELNNLDQKIDRLEKVLKEQQSSYHDLNPESNFKFFKRESFLFTSIIVYIQVIVQKMEEEARINAYLVNEKFPKEIESYKQKLKDCEVVAAKSVMSQSELNEIKKKIDDTNRELASLIERRDKNRDMSDDKLIMFRQQVSIFFN
jgi:intraflagellar transport protein 81